MSALLSSRSSIIASTSRLLPLAPTLTSTPLRRSKKTDAGGGKKKASPADAAARREAFYDRMNVTDDTRVLDQRDVLYGLQLDPKRREAYENERAKSLAEAMPFPDEVRETIVNARLLHQRRQREQEQAFARSRHKALVKALDDLERLDPVRFARAVETPACQKVRAVDEAYIDEEGRLPGLFPRQLRVPAYTTGTAPVFDAEWKRPARTEAGEDQAVSST